MLQSLNQITLVFNGEPSIDMPPSFGLPVSLTKKHSQGAMHPIVN